MKVGTDGVLLGAWADISKATQILDIGTGTGLIALISAQRSNAEINAVEIEENAYNQAKDNILNSDWAERIKLHHSSFQNFAKKTNFKFDHIISNPPFFTNSMKNQDTAKTLARHNDTLSFEDLIKGVRKIIDKNGKFSLIIPYDSKDGFCEIAEKENLFLSRITEVKPTPEKNPKRVLVELSLVKSEIIKNTITIETEKRHNYTKEYINLTKDFYLKM